jgi:hypothetical protein
MRRLLFLGVVCLMVAFGVGPAYSSPSPTDDPTTGDSSEQQSVLRTALFALGEVDLSTLGVSPTELLTVGPQVSLLSPNGDDVLIVDNDGLDCPNWEYPTIQSAVDAAMPGDKIKVCRGVYIEQVTIETDGLTLYSVPDLQAVIKAPPLMADPKAIVRVNGAQDVTIRHFTITGPGDGGCDSIRYGVRVDGGGSALITDNHITEIRDLLSQTGALSGCQNGHAVNIGRVADAGIGTGTVVHNLIDKYQKTGVLVSNGGSSAEVAYNEVVGTPSETIAQNGIQASAGVVADIHHNKVSYNVYTPTGTVAMGILLASQPGPTRIHHNDVFLNEDGIGIFTSPNGGVEISYNNSRNNLTDGIVVFDQSAEHLIAYNKAFENGRNDCRDSSTGPYNAPALVANKWVKDLGRTENKPGLCKDAGPQ